MRPYIASRKVDLNDPFAFENFNVTWDDLRTVAEFFKDDRMSVYEHQHGTVALHRDNQPALLCAIELICTWFDKQRNETGQYDAQRKLRLPPQKYAAWVSARAGNFYMERGPA